MSHTDPDQGVFPRPDSHFASSRAGCARSRGDSGLNVAGFFLLVYLAAQLLPASVAASVMSLSPLTLAGFGWLLAAERPSIRMLVGALAGIGGVFMLLGGATGHLSPHGVLASVSALLISSLGAVLGKRWRDDTPLLATTAWQLTFGGAVLAVAAAAVEGRLPHPDESTLTALTFTSFVATALAFLCWFAGLARIRIATVGVIGLLNPVTGVTLGTLVAGETLTVIQALGIGLTLLGVLVVTRQHVGKSRADLASKLP